MKFRRFSLRVFAAFALGSIRMATAQPCGAGPTIKPIDLTFVSKEGTGTLIGFDEFVNPSSPSRKYRTRTVSGTMLVQEFPSGNDCGANACPTTANISFAKVGSTNGGTFSGGGSLTILSETDTTVTYIVSGVAVSEADSGPVDARMNVNGSYRNGSTITFARGVQFQACVEVNWVQWTRVGPLVWVQAGLPLPTMDAWDIEEKYDPATSLLSRTRNSTTRVFGLTTTSPIPGGNAVTNGRPDLLYVPRISPFVGPIQPVYADVTTTKVARSTTGKGCVPGIQFGPASMYAGGVVNEMLTDEDTEDAAESRAAESLIAGTSNVAYRTTRTGLSFGFRRVAYTAHFNIVCPGDYLVTVNYTVKPRNSSGAGMKRALVVRKRFEPGVGEITGRIDPQLKDTDYTITSVEARYGANCGDETPGEGSFDIGSVRGWISLGRGPGAFSNGGVALDATTLTAASYTPELLVPVVAEPEVETLRDAAGLVRQIKATQVLMDVVTVSAACFEAKVYTSGQVGPIDPVTKLYAVSGDPILSYRFENPDSEAMVRLRITETRGASSRVFEYSRDAATNTWALTKSGLRTETETIAVVSGDTVKTSTVRDPDGATVSLTARTYHVFPWGEELIREVNDPAGAALTTTYEFYDAVVSTDPNYRRLRQRTDASGNWERFAYDTAGHLVKSVRPFLHAPPGTTDEALCRVTEHVYDTIADADGDGQPESRLTILERTCGVETARRYRIDWSKPQALGTDNCQRRHDIICTAVGATWDAPANLVTETLVFATGSFAGRARRAVNPDGTATLTTYSLAADGVLTTTTLTGAPDSGRTAITDGRRTVTLTNAAGYVTSQQIFDIASGFSLSLSVATRFDELGRPTRTDFDDGTYTTREYACCGLASERDRSGVVTAYTYDSLGRQQTQTRLGITRRTRYDADGRVVTTTRIGTDGSEMTQESNTYDLAGRLIESRDAMNRRTKYAEAFDAVTGLTTRTTTHPDGGTYVEVAARDGSRISVSGSAAAPRSFEYGVEANGVFTKEVRPGINANDRPTNSEWVKTFVDFAGRPSRTEFADGAITTARYNGAGQLASQADADGRTTLFAYNARGELLVTALDVNGNGQIDLAGDDRVARTSTTVAQKVENGVTYTVSRTLAERWETEQDAPTVVVVNEQSVDGTRTWQMSSGLTTKTVIATDGVGGRTVATTTPDGVTAQQSFLGERIIASSRISAAGVQIMAMAYAYDAHGRVESITDARNGATRFTYFNDDQVRTVTTPDPDTAREGPGYDPQLTTYAYDAAGRVQAVTAPDGGVMSTTYWPTGAVRRSWGARTFPAEYSYDPQGRLRTLTTWQDFAADTGRATTTWIYDAKRGWLERKKYADGTGPTYTYYPSGRLQTRTWARPGAVATYSYSAAGELTAVHYSDGTPDATFGYDRAGRPRTITDESGTRVLDYAADGQLAAEVYGAGPLAGFRLDRGYDGLTRPGSVTLSNPAGEPVQGTSYTYDIAGRLGSVASGTNSVAYAYAANSNLIETTTFRAGDTSRLVTTRAYDRLGRLTAITSTGASGQIGNSYTYDAANQRTRSTLADGAYWSYSYDPLGQVTSGRKYLSDDAPVLGEDHSWTFDSIGNRRAATKGGASATYRPNALNQYVERTVPGLIDVNGAASVDSTVTVAVNGEPPVRATRQGERFRRQVPINNTGAAQAVQLTITAVKNNSGPAGEDVVSTVAQSVLVPKSTESFQYDADGNLTDDARWHYTWDGENRLVAMETSASAALAGIARKRLEFTYDAGSRRIAKKVFNWIGATWALDTHVAFVYDGWNMVAELNARAGLAPIRTYTWGLDLSGTIDGAGGVGGLAAISDAVSSTTHFPAYDGNGNAIELVAATTGTVTANYDYNAFGALALIEGAFANGNPFRFSTKYYDGETGLSLFGYRYYSSEGGRWLNRDPNEESGGMNIFAFTVNSATNLVDADGRAPINPLQVVANVARGLIGIPFSLLSGDIFDAENLASVPRGKCRVLITINGIWNSDADARAINASMAVAKRYSGAVPLRAVNGTHFGGVGDLVQIIGNEIGGIDISAARVAKQVRNAAESIRKSGCCCGAIEVFAHSQGTMVFNRALPLLDAKVRRMIFYTGIGGEKLIANGTGLASVDNFVNVSSGLARDWVPVIGNEINPLRIADLPQVLNGYSYTVLQPSAASLMEHGFERYYEEHMHALASESRCVELK